MNFQRAQNPSVLRLAVIGLIRQGQSTLFHEHDITLRVAGVVIDKESPKSLDARALDIAEHRNQFVVSSGTGLLDAGHQLLEWPKTHLFDALLVHEALIQVAYFLGF